LNNIIKQQLINICDKVYSDESDVKLT